MHEVGPLLTITAKIPQKETVLDEGIGWCGAFTVMDMLSWGIPARVWSED